MSGSAAAAVGTEESVATGVSGPGSVVLDIGLDVGALVLYTAAEWCGREVDLTGPVSTHTAIRERSVAGRRFYAGVYPGLPAGEYHLHLGDAPTPAQVQGGRVTEIHHLDQQPGTAETGHRSPSSDDSGLRVAEEARRA